MSKVEVDTIDTTSSGSGTLTIGSSNSSAVEVASGKTFKVAREKTTSVTGDGSTTTSASAGDILLVDVSSATATIQLPTSPNVGDVVIVTDISAAAGTNNITVDRNSEKIEGAALNLTLAANKDSVKLLYTGSTYGWVRNLKIQGDTFISATGGTTTTSGDYKIHTFTSTGCFTVASVSSSCASLNDVSYMVVAGGAGGGGADNGAKGAGGGAGGFREGKTTTDTYTASPLNAGSGITVISSTYPITVGAGGAAGSGTPINSQSPDNGSNSVFSTITSTGGGKGATYDGNAAGPGGSGGGGAIGSSGTYTAAGTGNTPPVSPSQGNSGGTGTPYCGANHASRASAGGGGATAVGGNGGNVNPVGGVGGAGATTSISGSSTAYAGGGGGAGGTGLGGTGGTGGGGPGHTTYPGTGVAGTTNTGGGGGAAGVGTGGSPANLAGGAGGSGIVIIRYKYQ